MKYCDWCTRYAVWSVVRRNAGLRHGLYIFLGAILAFGIPFGVRALEISAWSAPQYRFDGEFLLATQDAYHWIAGAEGFEFGTGHPMSEFIRILSLLFDANPANVGFWLPLYLGSALSLGIHAWAVALGYPAAGIFGGSLASLSVGFLARTLLGYCDTDLVILLFATMLGFVPMLWLRGRLSAPWSVVVTFAVYAFSVMKDAWRVSCEPLLSEKGAGKKFLPVYRRGVAFVAAVCAGAFRWGGRARAHAAPPSRQGVEADAPCVASCAPRLSWGWYLALVVSGLWGWSTQEWHSYFPYAVRFSSLLLPFLIIMFGPSGGRKQLLGAALCHCLPLLAGWWGGGLALVFGYLHHSCAVEGATMPALRVFPAFPTETRATLQRLLLSPWCLGLLWAALALLVVNASTWAMIVNSVSGYVKAAGHMADNAQGSADPLVFPSVALSINEIQNLTFSGFLYYFHPWPLVSLLGLAGYVYLCCIYPVALYFFLPFAIALSSFVLGGRMAMFAAPVLSFGISVGGAHLLKKCSALLAGRLRFTAGIDAFFAWHQPFSRWRLCAAVLAALVCAQPVIRLLPQLSSGPIISREQAEAFAYIRTATPPDSVVWDWWDWGYAAHHFARRITIADGARHGGPSLFVPAAVYTTSDAFFARQLMALTSEHNAVPGDVFEGMTATEADALITDLAAGKIAPQPKSKQYLVVSLEMVPLGHWITTYGNWDFIARSGKGYTIVSIMEKLQYNKDTGVVFIKNEQPQYARTIDIFRENGLQRKTYTRENSQNHFIFNLIAGNESKYAADTEYYNTLMYQLLVAGRDDPRFAAHFKLVFDNTVVRVYEMQ